MKRSIGKKNRAFTLSEISLALGIAAFCLISILGLLSVGLKGTGDITRRSQAAEVASVVIADLRESADRTASSLYGIPMNTGTTLYLSEAGGAGEVTNFIKVDGTSGLARYRVEVSLERKEDQVLMGEVEVLWPVSGTKPLTTSKVAVPVVIPLF